MGYRFRSYCLSIISTSLNSLFSRGVSDLTVSPASLFSSLSLVPCFCVSETPSVSRKLSVYGYNMLYAKIDGVILMLMPMSTWIQFIIHTFLKDWNMSSSLKDRSNVRACSIKSDVTSQKPPFSSSFMSWSSKTSRLTPHS